MPPKKKIIADVDLDDLFSLFEPDPESVPVKEDPVVDSVVDEILQELDSLSVEIQELDTVETPIQVEEPELEVVLNQVEEVIPDTQSTGEIPIGLTEMPPPRPTYIVDRPKSSRSFDCGHTNHNTPIKMVEEAQRRGYCCPQGMPSRASDMYGSGMPIPWDRLNGAYIRPVPVTLRRTLTVHREPSKQGYCCDDEGWYIGGVRNYCVADRPEGAPLCTAHRPQQAPAIIEPEITYVSPEKEAPVRKSSKQRQLEAKKKTRS